MARASPQPSPGVHLPLAFDRDCTLWIGKRELERVWAEAVEKAPLETGGILMGYWDGDNGLVTHVVGPGSEATHREQSFAPDYPYHRRMAAEIYERSGRTETYLGDWHTHPGSGAYMSADDRATAQRIAADQEARCVEPVMMILGLGPIELKAWRYGPGLIWPVRRFTRCRLRLLGASDR